MLKTAWPCTTGAGTGVNDQSTEPKETFHDEPVQDIHPSRGLLAALCLLVLLVGAEELLGIGQSNAGLKSVYDDRVVPLKQIKVVADM